MTQTHTHTKKKKRERKEEEKSKQKCRYSITALFVLSPFPSNFFFFDVQIRQKEVLAFYFCPVTEFVKKKNNNNNNKAEPFCFSLKTYGWMDKWISPSRLFQTTGEENTCINLCWRYIYADDVRHICFLLCFICVFFILVMIESFCKIVCTSPFTDLLIIPSIMKY